MDNNYHIIITVKAAKIINNISDIFYYRPNELNTYLENQYSNILNKETMNELKSLCFNQNGDLHNLYIDLVTLSDEDVMEKYLISYDLVKFLNSELDIYN